MDVGIYIIKAKKQKKCIQSNKWSMTIKYTLSWLLCSKYITLSLNILSVNSIVLWRANNCDTKNVNTKSNSHKLNNDNSKYV